MISILISLAVLLLGYLLYGRLTEKVFAPDGRNTPAIAVNDGVDCVPMKPWKASRWYCLARTWCFGKND
ncbi:MAG: hypothetical protein K5663_00425 [Clostridiales bacterium]|nr:hypothetical protein [Clostridiales bacterium]